MKLMKLMKSFKLHPVQLIMVMCLFLMSCAVGGMTTQKQLIVAYGTYNSQFASYMTETGYVVDLQGEWAKVSNPALSEDQKKILRKKYVILEKMYPLLKIYDSMVLGSIPYSADIEQQLIDLVGDLDKLIE
ncbi:MAG: hypothetical protein P9L97_06085 [Candidatus Tenebribacter davisii]|nr:hypothetical protein [Candidatus Tenebribacter davisii]